MALLFVLGGILGATAVLGRGFSLDGGRSGPLPLTPLVLLWPFREGEVGSSEAWLTLLVLDGLRVPRTEDERLKLVIEREGVDVIIPEACEDGRRTVWARGGLILFAEPSDTVRDMVGFLNM